MIIGRIVLIGLSLVAFNVGSTKPLELKPSWRLTLHDPNLSEGVFSFTPQTNRSCGIARWDQTHVLIYFMSNTKNLVVRSPVATRVGGWSFSILIVKTQDGEVEQSATIPADSSQSELAVVAGGIVVSDRDHLVLYSRAFTRIDPAFVYSPLGIRLRNGELGDREHLYVFDDQKHFLLFDDNAHNSHFYLFDGTTLKLLSDWIFKGVNAQRLQVRGQKIIYGRLIFGGQETNTFWWTSIDASNGTVPVFSTSRDVVCRFPISTQADTFLEACGPIKIAKEGSSTIVYEPHRNEVVSELLQISPDDRYAAILRYDYKYGGVLDLDEHWIRPGFLIVDLNVSGHVCEISLNPVPRSQLAMNFANDSTLIVLNDGMVSAYKSLCAQ